MAKSLSSKATARTDSGEAVQYGALCWRLHRGKVEVMLITSRDTGRWVIPKGWPMEGRTPAGAALQEAWEEAGVLGDISGTTIGRFSYAKLVRPTKSVACCVEVFGLRVREVKDNFPERKERRRKWFSAPSAARKVAEPELRALLTNAAVVLGQAAAPAPAD